jgi:hypothetical protein
MIVDRLIILVYIKALLAASSSCPRRPFSLRRPIPSLSLGFARPPLLRVAKLPRRCSASWPPFLVHVVIFPRPIAFPCLGAAAVPRSFRGGAAPRGLLFLSASLFFSRPIAFSRLGAAAVRLVKVPRAFVPAVGPSFLLAPLVFSGFFRPLLSPSVPLRGAAFLEGPSSAAPDLLRRRHPRWWSTILF